MIAILLASLLASAVAFAPTTHSFRSSSPMTMMSDRSKSVPFLLKPNKLDGSMAGDEGFDPLGLSNINDIGIDLFWMREAELKHSRVAMLAVTGAVAQEMGLVFPGQPIGKDQIDVFWEFFGRNPGPIFAGTLFIGVVELISWLAIYEGKKVGRTPGDFGIKNFGKTEAQKKDYELKEIRNGRLAMWAAMGILMQGATTGTGALSNLFGL